MLTNRAPKERQINNFKKPFDLNNTPYKLEDFHKLVKDFCKKLKIRPQLMIAKTIFIGDIGVGKTSLINRFRVKTFSENSRSTIGVDCFLEGFDVLGVPFNIQIWDTAGQERFRCIATPYFRGTTVVVLVFDLSNVETLYNCERWLDTALESTNLKRTPYIVLVGNKLDNIISYEYNEIKELAVFLAKKLGAEYWIVSSKTGENVEHLFRRLAVLAFEWMILKDVNDPDNEVIELKNEHEVKEACAC